MTLTVLRRWSAVIASFGALALVAGCSGTSPSSSLSLTGPSGALRSSSGDVVFSPNPGTIDPCVDATPAGVDFRTNPGDTPPPPPPPLCDGRFTGGGFQINANDVKVTRGFELHCDALLSNNFEVNWKDASGNAHNFHTDKNPEVAECSKPVLPNPPDAGVSRIVILNQPGSLDGADGHTITIVLEDHGEPGTEDRAYIAIDTIGITNGSVASPALIDGGNVQAHFDQPHKNN